MARAGAGQGAEDRPSQADLHRRPAADLHPGLGALGLSTHLRTGPPDLVCFDLGNVVVDWQPHPAVAAGVGEAEASAFLAAADVDFRAWNHGPDSGATWAQALADLEGDAPHWLAAGRSYVDNFGASLVGEVAGTGDLVRALHRAGTRLWALTNWSAELWPQAPARFEVLSLFEQVTVSGVEGVAKPDHAAYRLVVERSGVAPGAILFVDDRDDNVEAAREVGMDAVVFADAEQLRADLLARGLPV